MSKPHFLGLPEGDIKYVVSKVGANRWRQLSGKRLLLTGCTGFIGKWLLASVLEAMEAFEFELEVVAVSRNPRVFWAEHTGLEAHPNISWIKYDIRDLKVWGIEPCGFAIHAATDVVATSRARDIFETCVIGTQRVIDLVDDGKGGGRALLLSSGAVYGSPKLNMLDFDEDWHGAPDPLSPSSAYGEGKRASELIFAMAAEERPSLSYAIARCFAFVGPHLPLDKHFAIGNFIRAALRNEDITINGDGTPIRSYLYASDLAHWLWVMLFEAPSARAYNVGCEESISIGALASRVNSVLGGQGSINIISKPDPEACPSVYVPSVDRIKNELGLSPDIGLDEAIKRTAEWVKNYNKFEVLR
jgi:nucleoside-diphosphate-sugar epimerase